MKNACRFLPLLALIVLLSSCQDHDLTTTIVSQNDLRLNSMQELPANQSPATGTANVTYDKSTRKLTYIITYENLSGNPTMGHIHGGTPRGSNAPVLFFLQSLPAATSGAITGSETLTAQQEDDLLNGMYYFNIHTSAYPGGEIRGQIEFYSQPFIVSKKGLPIDPAQAKQNLEPLAIGSMDVSYNKRTKRLSYYITWNNTPNLIGIVIGGPAAKGIFGPDKQALTSTSNLISYKALSGSVVVDESILKESELLNGLYFVNFINVTVRPTGPFIPPNPLRGQIEF